MSDSTLKDSTLNEKNGRYVLGGNTEVSVWAIEWWEKKTLPSDPTDFAYFVERKYEARPDLIALTFYGDSNLWWVIAQYNSIIDPLAELVEGQLLFLPTPERVNLFRTNANVGGFPSSRNKT
jgi:hypothetical protein